MTAFEIPKTRERARSRLKRFDTIYGSAALYICLAFAFTVVAVPLASRLASASFRWLPATSPPAYFLVGTFAFLFGAATLVGLALGRCLRFMATKTGRVGIAIGGTALYAAFFWTYLRPLYEEHLFRRPADGITWTITIVDTILYAYIHFAALAFFRRE